MAEPRSFDLKKCQLQLVDGSGTPKTLTVKFGEGNLTYTQRKNREYKLDRGKLATGEVRDGDDEPMEVSFDGVFTKLTSSTGEAVSIPEFLDQIGAASSHATTGDACEPYAIDLVLSVDAACGTIEDEIITFDQFRYEELNGDFGEGTISVTGKCKAVRPTSVRTTTVTV